MIARVAEILAYLGKTSPTEAELAMVGLLHPLVEQQVKTWLGYSVEQANYTAYLPGGSSLSGDGLASEVFDDVVAGRVMYRGGGGGSQELFLPELPVRSITSLHLDLSALAGSAPGAFAAGTALAAGVDFYLDLDDSGACRSGKLVRYAGWPGTPRSVKVVYVAGYSRDELDGNASGPLARASAIKYWTIVAVAAAFRAQKSNSGSGAGVVSEGLAGWFQSKDRETVAPTLELPMQVKTGLLPFWRPR
jgi:hypothetical protein